MQRKSSQFRCHECGVLMHTDADTSFNTLFIFHAVQWSRQAQDMYAIHGKAGMVLKGRCLLTPARLPQVLYHDGRYMLYKGRPVYSANKERLNDSPPNCNPPTSAVPQSVVSDWSSVHRRTPDHQDVTAPQNTMKYLGEMSGSIYGVHKES